MREREYLLVKTAHCLIGIGVFFLYIYHVRSIFETRTNFSHLNQLERESLLRKDDALYYSFYKTIVEQPTFQRGVNKLMNVTSIEYPNSVNVLSRFHVFPEVIVGFYYHSFKDFCKRFDITIDSCSTLNVDSITNQNVKCNGIGEPFNFYLEFVWLLGGFTVLILYIYGAFLSDNIFGGLYAVVLYIIFHKNASKIYDRPMSRENFAFPFIFWQMFYLTLCSSSKKTYNNLRPLTVIKLTVLTTVSLLCWQFSSVIFAAQVIIVIAQCSLGFASNWFGIDYAISQILASLFAYWITAENTKFLVSWQNGPALTLSILCLDRLLNIRPRLDSKEMSWKYLSLGIFMAFGVQGVLTDFIEKIGYSSPMDNPYSVYRDLILHWSLQRRANFTISLLACNSDFGDIDMSDFFELIKTLFIKPYCLYGVVVLEKFFRKWRMKESRGHNKEHIERVKKYVLEDFLEENHISMKEMSNKDTEKDLNACWKLLEECDYNYDRYKVEKKNAKKDTEDTHESFLNDIKKLKKEINENEKQQELKSKINTKEITDEQKSATEDNKIPDPTDVNGCLEGINKEDAEKDHTQNLTKKKNRKKNFYNGNFFNRYMYSVLQLAMFATFGFFIKKLFFLCFTQGCVIAPTLCSKFLYHKQNNIFWSISLTVFLTSIVDPGIQNLQQEYLPSQAYNEEVGTLLEWINLNTEKEAIFGGPIDIIGTVHLATKRPIVNHPHLDMKQMSKRTEGIYSIFSRQQSSDIFNQCSQMKIQYLIVSFDDCLNSSKGGNECDILSIWDELQPGYRKFPPFCSELWNKNIPSFLKVFSNKNYGILKMFSQSVQINFKPMKMPEKMM